MLKNMFDTELEFTEIYKQSRTESPAMREVKCLEKMFETYFDTIQKGDLFAGRITYLSAGFGLEITTGGSLYFCKPKKIRDLIHKNHFTKEYKNQIEAMLEFWDHEMFLDMEAYDHPASKGQLINRLPPEVFKATTNHIADMGGRVSGTFINYDKLLTLGIPGLKTEITAHRVEAVQQGLNVALYDAMLKGLDVLIAVCNQYALEAQNLISTTVDDEWKIDLLQMQQSLEAITTKKPETLREAMQLMWLYTCATQTINHGRMDVYFGDFLAADLASGRLTKEEAIEYIKEIWKLIAYRKVAANEFAEFNGRVIIGGKGRRNEENADQFSMLAMEATRQLNLPEPQLSLRFYKGMNPEIMKKALDVIGEGKSYPMLYNDDVNIPATKNAFGVSFDEAMQYLPYGCGEYAIDHIALGSPNCSMNMLKAVEVVLHNGREANTHELMGLATGNLSEFDTFEKFFNAYKKQVEYHVDMLAKRHSIEYELENEMAAFVYASMLYDGCLESGKSVFGGGVKYKGSIIESFGMTNAADSLTAIKELVYDKKLMTLSHLVKVLDADFIGYEKEYRYILGVPKFGNDDDKADYMLNNVNEHICKTAMAAAPKYQLDYCLIVNINNYYNVEFGKATAASADGRRAGSPYANGNTPTAGFDKNGSTAMLNSLVKINPYYHAGYSHNMKFGKKMFKEERQKLEALLNTYFSKGGTQAMITVVSRDDLENAMKDPAQYGNIIVRVGGFSARFVELSKEIQMDVLNRTLHE